MRIQPYGQALLQSQFIHNWKTTFPKQGMCPIWRACGMQENLLIAQFILVRHASDCTECQAETRWLNRLDTVTEFEIIKCLCLSGHKKVMLLVPTSVKSFHKLVFCQCFILILLAKNSNLFIFL